MKKAVVVAFILLISISAGFSEEMLVGISYFIDDEGTIYPDRGHELKGTRVPFIRLIDFTDDFSEATLYYHVGNENTTESVGVIGIDDDSPMTTFQLQSETYGDIKFVIGDEVIADELGAAVCTHMVFVEEHWYVSIGVMAVREFQSEDEQRELFDEIIADMTGE